jgi:hypothetical protein
MQAEACQGGQPTTQLFLWYFITTLSLNRSVTRETRVQLAPGTGCHVYSKMATQATQERGAHQ